MPWARVEATLEERGVVSNDTLAKMMYHQIGLLDLKRLHFTMPFY